MACFVKGQIPWNKGRKFIHSGSFKKGHKPTYEGSFEKGSIPWNKGTKGIMKPNSGSIKKGIIPWNKGKHYKLKNTSNMGKLKGEKNNLWKGGITPLMQQIRTSLQYSKWRLAVFTRDNFSCQNCHQLASGNMEAHHMKQMSKIIEENKITNFNQALNCQELWDVNNGVTLCKECHQQTDTYLNNGRWN